MKNKFLEIEEYAAAGLYEEPSRSLFYRKALGLRRFFENCILPEYTGRPLYPSGRIERKMKVHPSYLTGLFYDDPELNEKHPELAKQLKADFCQYVSSVPHAHTVAGNMFTHSMPNYGRIVREGFNSYKERVLKIEDADMRDGLIHLIEGIGTYADRCVAYLESVSADPKLIAALKKVPMNPSENIYEAILAWNFALYLDCCDNLGCVALELGEFHRGEDVSELLENLYDNLDDNGGYSMALGTGYNSLTVPCLRASRGKRRPMIELFVDETTPDEVWEEAFRVIRTSNGQPAFYSPNQLKGLVERIPSLTEEDVRKFCGGGCTESMIQGYSNCGSLDAGINLMRVFEDVINTKLKDSRDFEEFYGYYIAAVAAVVENVCCEISNSQVKRAKCNPLPMRTLLVDDCIDNGLDFNNGGARYKWSNINFAGMINVIDSLINVRDLVFTEQKYTKEGLLKALADNDPEFLSIARNNPHSHGRDDDSSNLFANRVTSDIYSMLDGKKPAMGEAFLPASIQFSSYGIVGKRLGASPDGRENGAPLCDSLGAILGKDVEGPTALLKSVASLDQKRVLGTPVLNFNIDPNFTDGVLKGLILSYFELGGRQMQITCTSREVLLDAYEHPELHKNLVVRVGGYSEYFHLLSDDLKRAIIDRTMQKME